MVITSKKEKTATIKFYGQIGRWEYNGRNFSNVFEDLDEKYDNIIIRLHCYGGEVFEGNVIFNAISNAKSHTTIIIDGVAASMAGIIMLAADEIKMAENAFVMIHSPSGYTSGNAKDHLNAAKLLRSMEQNFAVKYAAKTSKPEADIKQWFDGSDYWFDAKECKEMGLIDTIVNSTVKDIGVLDKQKASMLGSEAVYNKYAAKLLFAKSNQKKTNMDKSQIIAKFELKGVSSESSDTAVLEALEAKFNETKTAKNEAEKTLAEFHKTEINGLIDAAVKGGKINDAQKSTYVSIGEKAGIEALRASLDGISEHESISKFISGKSQGTGKNSEDRSNWTWDGYQDKNPKALEVLKEKEKEKFIALYEAKYNIKPKF